MDNDVQILPNRDSDKKSGFPKQIVFFAFGVLFLLTSIGIGSYYVGRRSVQGAKTENTESIKIPDPSIVVTVTDTPTPTQEASSSGTLTPTKKGSPTPSVFSKTMILKSVGKIDGYITSDRAVTTTNDIRVGDNGQSALRGFVSFDLSTLPQGVKIGKATMRLYQSKVEGNPFSSHGALKIDYLTYGETLEATDYGQSALSLSFATIPQSTTEGWKEIDVTAKVKEDLTNARSLSQFRIHFTNETVGSEKKENYVSFESAENTNKTGDTPQLVVSY